MVQISPKSIPRVHQPTPGHERSAVHGRHGAGASRRWKGRGTRTAWRRFSCTWMHRLSAGWTQASLAQPRLDAAEVECVAAAARQAHDARLPSQLVTERQLKGLKADSALLLWEGIGADNGVLASQQPQLLLCQGANDLHWHTTVSTATGDRAARPWTSHHVVTPWPAHLPWQQPDMAACRGTLHVCGVTSSSTGVSGHGLPVSFQASGQRRLVAAWSSPGSVCRDNPALCTEGHVHGVTRISRLRIVSWLRRSLDAQKDVGAKSIAVEHAKPGAPRISSSHLRCSQYY